MTDRTWWDDEAAYLARAVENKHLRAALTTVNKARVRYLAVHNLNDDGSSGYAELHRAARDHVRGKR